MTDEQIQIAVAEELGWQRYASDHSHWIPKGWQWGRDAYGLVKATHELPDWPNDLDACAEMRKALTDDERLDFASSLIRAKITVDEDGKPVETDLFDEYGWYGLLEATPRHQCETFLRLRGKWKVTP